MKVFVKACELRDIEELVLEEELSAVRDQFIEQIAPDPKGFFDDAFTLLFDGRPVACFGVFLHWEGVGRAWTFLSPEARSKPLSLHRSVKKALGRYIDNNEIHRIEATVATDFPEATRWVERLGFDHECLMRKYAPGGFDHHLYARVQ